MAKKNEEAAAPRMSQIERLQQQLTEAQAKAAEREQRKIEVLKQQFEAAVIRQNKAQAKVSTIRLELFDLGVTPDEAADIEFKLENIAYPGAE